MLQVKYYTYWVHWVKALVSERNHKNLGLPYHYENSDLTCLFAGTRVVKNHDCHHTEIRNPVVAPRKNLSSSESSPLSCYVIIEESLR